MPTTPCTLLRSPRKTRFLSATPVPFVTSQSSCSARCAERSGPKCSVPSRARRRRSRAGAGRRPCAAWRARACAAAPSRRTRSVTVGEVWIVLRSDWTSLTARPGRRRRRRRAQAHALRGRAHLHLLHGRRRLVVRHAERVEDRQDRERGQHVGARAGDDRRDAAPGRLPPVGARVGVLARRAAAPCGTSRRAPRRSARCRARAPRESVERLAAAGGVAGVERRRARARAPASAGRAGPAGAARRPSRPPRRRRAGRGRAGGPCRRCARSRPAGSARCRTRSRRTLRLTTAGGKPT